MPLEGYSIPFSSTQEFPVQRAERHFEKIAHFNLPLFEEGLGGEYEDWFGAIQRHKEGPSWRVEQGLSKANLIRKDEAGPRLDGAVR